MANLVELFDNIVQMQNLNGVPLAAGKLYVYALGRTRLMDSWSDVDGESLNPNPIILDDAGQAHVYVSDDFDYTLVVCDQYNNEIFSLDKYLYSKGSHSHADVAVAPSESIAVSSYHVGECTVYVPYLTGQLGKVYEGIDPIVVNNQVDKISANHVPLGVQDPLYFVQDDEEACIIGFSGETLPEGTMNESAFGYEDGKITGYNGSGFSAGLNYEAGSYVDIDGNTINVTGLTPVPADTASTGLVASVSADITAMIPDVSDMATQTWVNEQGFLTAHQDISNKLDTTAFSTVSGDFLTAVPSEYVTENTLQSGLSSKLDSTAFSTVSGDFLTAHQSLDGLMSADLLEISDNKITGYNGTAFAGQGGVTGDYELVAGSGVELVDDPDAHTTTINVTAQGGESNVITDNGEFTVLPNTLGTNVTIKYPTDVPAYGEPSAVPFHAGEWVEWVGNSGADPNNNGSTLGMILHYSDTTPINLEGEQIQVTLPHTISGVNGMRLYYLNPGFSAPVAGPNASNAITSNTNTYSAGKYTFNCVGNPYSAGTGTYGCYLGLGFSRAAVVYGPSSIDAIFDTVEYGPATGYEVNLDRYIPSGDNYIGVGVNSATKQTIISAKYNLTGQLNKIYPTYTAVSANSATWNGVSSKADKDSLLDLKSEFISDNGTYILHVPSACDIIGTQLSSYDIVRETRTTNVSLTGMEIDWQRPYSGTASFDINTTTATMTFRSEYGPVDFILLDSNKNVVCSSYQDHDGAIFTTALSGLNTGTYIAKIESTAQDYIFSNNTLIAASGEENITDTYSGLFIGGGVPQSAFDELKQSYDALSALFAQYSGQWLLPNEGEE